MKRLNKKKGFTIVELVIVIAVVGILAAVLMPTFSNIIEKAQISNDLQLIRNLNIALEIEKASQPGSAYVTPHDAFTVCDEYGYTVDKIVSKSEKDITFDCVNQRFVLLDAENNKVLDPSSTYGSSEYEVEEDAKANYFRVTSASGNKFESSNGYSIYAGYQFNAEEVVLDGVGFDAGDVDCVKKITYKNSTGSAKNVIIRTSRFDTKLVINELTTADEIKHFGFVGNVNVGSLAASSYNEYGTAGRVIATQQATSSYINIKSGATVYQVEQTGNSFVSVDSNSTLYDIEGNKISYTQNNPNICKNIAIQDADNGCKHETTSVFGDGKHLYEVCTKCGYTVVTVNDTNKYSVAASNLASADNIITPRCTYVSTSSDFKSLSNNGDVYADGLTMIVAPAVATSADNSALYCSGGDHQEKYVGNGKDDKGKFYHTVTCEVEDCKLNYTEYCNLGYDGKCVKCGQAFDEGLYSIDNVKIENIDLSIDDQGKLTSIGNLSNVDHVILPDEVKTIDYTVFYNNKQVKNVVIPASVESITYEKGFTGGSNKGAFQNCTNLKSVTFLSDKTGECGLTETGKNMFRGCTNLTSVTLPESLEKVSMYTFFGCSSLVDINLPENLESIEEHAFECCTSLNTVTLPSSIKTVCGQAFQYCSNLEYVDFSQCTDLTAISTTKDNWTDQGQTFCGCYNLKYVDLSNTKITYIPGSCFSKCYSLVEVKLPDTVIEYHAFAFDYCKNLCKFTIPSYVEFVDAYWNNHAAFFRCDALYDIVDLRDFNTYKVNDQRDWVNRPFSYNGFAYYGYTKGVDAYNDSLGYEQYYVNNQNIDEGGAYIDESKFTQDVSFVHVRTSLDDSTNLKYVGDCQFYDDGTNMPILLKYCGLVDDADIYLPDYKRDGVSVNYKVHENAFAYRNFTGTLHIPANCIDIDTKVFTSFQRIDGFWDESSASVPTTYYYGLANINAVIVDSANPTYSSYCGVLYNKAMTDIVYIPANISGSLVIPSTVTNIADKTFGYNQEGWNYKLITSLSFEASDITIGNECFTGLNKVTSLSFAGDVNIGNYCFANLSNLNSLSFGGTVTIGDECFGYIKNLTSLSFSDTVNIGKNCFVEMEDITSITFMDDATIGYNSFRNLTNLTTLSFGGDAILDMHVFSKSKSLTTITLPANYEYNNNNFSYAPGITTICINGNNTATGLETLPNLTSITVGTSTRYTAIDGVLYYANKSDIVCVPSKYSGLLFIPKEFNSFYSLGEYIAGKNITELDIEEGNSRDVRVVGGIIYEYYVDPEYTYIEIGGALPTVSGDIVINLTANDIYYSSKLFAYNKNITSVSFSQSSNCECIYFDEYIFEGCENLKEVKLSINNSDILNCIINDCAFEPGCMGFDCVDPKVKLVIDLTDYSDYTKASFEDEYLDDILNNWGYFFLEIVIVDNK